MESLHSTQQNHRFPFVDALRGIACLMVMFNHLVAYNVFQPLLLQNLPPLMVTVLDLGSRGVQVFFVISGFVIAHSVRNMLPGFSAAAHFTLKRLLRLAPPFWSVVFLALIFWTVELQIPALETPQLPQWTVVISNLFFINHILNLTSILGVSWTLCIEIQFYLIFILLHTVSVIRTGSHLFLQRHLLQIMVTVLGYLSLFVPIFSNMTAWFIPYWSHFAAGALCYWSRNSQSKGYNFLSFVTVMTVLAIQRNDQALLAGSLTSLLLFILARHRNFSQWTLGPVFQYFGRVSYSLYLVHLLVMSAILRLGYKRTENNWGAALAWHLLAIVSSVIVADVLFRLVERPSMKISNFAMRSNLVSAPQQVHQ